MVCEELFGHVRWDGEVGDGGIGDGEDGGLWC